MTNKYSDFQCPKCGRWSGDDSIVDIGDPEPNDQKSIEFGVSNPLDWVEKHKCPSCNTEYQFLNSNC